MKQIKTVVKKKFRDRITGVSHKVGDKLTVTDARFREIKRSGDYVEIEASSKEKEKTEITKK
jgi:transcription elongation factor